MLTESRQWLIDHKYLAATPKKQAAKLLSNLYEDKFINLAGTVKATLKKIKQLEKYDTWEDFYNG